MNGGKYFRATFRPPPASIVLDSNPLLSSLPARCLLADFIVLALTHCLLTRLRDRIRYVISDCHTARQTVTERLNSRQAKLIVFSIVYSISRPASLSFALNGGAIRTPQS